MLLGSFLRKHSSFMTGALSAPILWASASYSLMLSIAGDMNLPDSVDPSVLLWPVVIMLSVILPLAAAASHWLKRPVGPVPRYALGFSFGVLLTLVASVLLSQIMRPVPA